MNYFELKAIKESTKLLPWKDRTRSFSEGVCLISKYLSSDFPNLHVFSEKDSTGDSELIILYGDITEILENGITEDSAKRLFELGWFIEDGIDVYDGYFKFKL